MDKVINIDDDRHRAIAWHYGAFPEMLKLREELIELQVEANISMKSVPTKLHENMWSEMADVINCIIHVAIQWGKVDTVLSEIDRKLDRQIKRMGDE